MTWYKMKADVGKELNKKRVVELMQFFIDLLNLGGFHFKPSKHRPDIQKFIDKYSDLVEPADEN